MHSLIFSLGYLALMQLSQVKFSLTFQVSVPQIPKTISQFLRNGNFDHSGNLKLKSGFIYNVVNMCLILSKQYMFHGNIKKATYFNHVTILRSLVCL